MQRQPGWIQKHGARRDCRWRDCHWRVLDESSLQFSRPMVADVDRVDVQTLAGVVEPGKYQSKHCADFARSRLVFEMDRFAARGDRRIHDVLSSAVPETNR